jgi:hypothetical protein
LGLLSPQTLLSGVSMKIWERNADFARGSRIIIVALRVGAVKIYAATVEALKEKERQDETQFATKTEAPHP